MRMPSWIKTKAEQLDLLEPEAAPPLREAPASSEVARAPAPTAPATATVVKSDAGQPLLVPLHLIDEDPNNPRTEFPDSAIATLADDIRERGILEPIVVHPADAAGRYRMHFGAMRCRAARRVGLDRVPVVIRDAPADPYAQVAENQKRHGLTPLDLARLIRARVDAGESNATIAKHLVMDLTTVAHHLALLDLPPELDAAMKSGRCTSPKTLHELNKLHLAQPEQAKALIAGDGDITRAAVAAARASAVTRRRSGNTATSLLTQANSACARLEQTLTKIEQRRHELSEPELTALRQRLATLAGHLA
jgi:ParB family transcriptional regulator, chromosome partitioning protein